MMADENIFKEDKEKEVAVHILNENEHWIEIGHCFLNCEVSFTLNLFKSMRINSELLNFSPERLQYQKKVKSLKDFIELKITKINKDCENWWDNMFLCLSPAQSYILQLERIVNTENLDPPSLIIALQIQCKSNHKYFISLCFKNEDLFNQIIVKITFHLMKSLKKIQQHQQNERHRSALTKQAILNQKQDNTMVIQEGIPVKITQSISHHSDPHPSSQVYLIGGINLQQLQQCGIRLPDSLKLILMEDGDCKYLCIQEFLSQFCEFILLLQHNGSDPCIDTLYKIFPLLKRAFLLPLASVSFIPLSLSPGYFPAILTLLSYSAFGDRLFNYHQEYNTMVRIHGYLLHDDTVFNNAYGSNIRVKFMRDVAICMFIEQSTLTAFAEIIDQNNLTIINRIVKNQGIFSSLITMEPAIYLSIFIQFMETFKSVQQSQSNSSIKLQFYQLLLKYNILPIAIKNMQIYRTNPNQTRIHTQNQLPPISVPKWLQSINPILSFNWQKGMQLLAQTRLLSILITILQQNPTDMDTILMFIRNILIPSINRKTMPIAHISHVMHQFLIPVTRIITPSHMGLYLQFLTSIQVVHPIIIRRVIIATEFMQGVSSGLLVNNKYMQIAVVKFLCQCIEGDDEGIIQYCSANNIFGPLNEVYLQVKGRRSNGVLRSLFNKLFSLTGTTKNIAGKALIAALFHL